MRKIVRRFKDMSINKKLYFTILCCLIFPLIIVFCFMNGVIGKEFRESQQDKELEILKQSKPVVENVLNDIEMISRDILGNDYTQTLLKYYGQTGEYEENARVQLDFYLRNLMSSREYLSSVSVYKDENILLQCGNYFEKESTAEVSGLKEKINLDNGGAVWEPARILPYYVAGNENEYVVSLQRNINNMYKPETMGTERISIKEEYLCSLYTTNEISENTRMYIFDLERNIVSANDKRMLGTQAEELVTEKTTKEEGVFRTDHGERVILYYTIPLNGWVVVKEMPAKEMDSQILLINIIIWICLGLILFFGLAFSLIQKREIMNPIMKLSRAAGKVGENNFKIALYTTNNDEVGMLNQSMISMIEKISELIETVYKSRIQMQEAEILSLQSQINPHFLYNTLDTLRWISLEHGEREIAEQIEALSNLFRHVLNSGNEMTTIQAELDHLQNYLVIQYSRFGNKIRTSISADERIKSCRVVKLVLQPLVENAFVHGLEKKVGGGKIRVTVDEWEGKIRYIVEDNGMGTDETEVNTLLETDENISDQNFSALKNIKNRLRLKYGDNYSLYFESKIGIGTRVTVIIPCGEEENDEDTNSR